MNENEGEEMHHECINDGKFVTLKTLIVASFALFSTITIPIITGFFFVIDLKLEPIKDNVKRNELRAARLENSIITSESKLTGIDKKIGDLVSALKYVYPTKEYVDKELKKKVDLDRIDKRNLKN